MAKKYIIKTLNKEYTDEMAGIKFVNGISEVKELTEEDVVWFKNFGHEVEEVKEPVNEDKKAGK